MQSLKESTVTACLHEGGTLIPAEKNSRRLRNWKCEHHGSSSVESATSQQQIPTNVASVSRVILDPACSTNHSPHPLGLLA